MQVTISALMIKKREVWDGRLGGGSEGPKPEAGTTVKILGAAGFQAGGIATGRLDEAHGNRRKLV